MNGPAAVFAKAAAAARFALGTRRSVRAPLSAAVARERIARQLDGRVDAFLHLIDHAVFANPRSPYVALFRHAGIERGDVAGLVARDGVEATLVSLFEAGVRLSLDEFKGRRPIVRPGLELACRASDFDNPTGGSVFEARTGGSRGTGSRLFVDLDLLAYEACYMSLLLDADRSTRAIAIWRPAPPGYAGLANALRYAKAGRSAERWFSHQPCGVRDQPAEAAFVLGLALAAWAGGARIPVPEHVALAAAVQVAQWAADTVAAGRPALIDTNSSSAVRVCQASAEYGLDITGTTFRVGGEPYTPAKARILGQAGCRAICHYSLTESGMAGAACIDADEPDEVHLLVDKLAIVARPVRPRGSDITVDALFLTSLLPVAPKILINVETGDYATLTRRRCGCPFGALGLDARAHTVRSYEKLTCEGMHFVGSDLLTLLEDVLPGRFGGRATDYQLVEEEVRGLPTVSLVVSPRVGVVDEVAVRATALDTLARVAGRAGPMMSDRWRDANTLHVLRREPHVTVGGKVQALHAGPARTDRS